MTIRTAFTLGVDIAGRRPPGADPQGQPHHAAAGVATRSGCGPSPGVDAGDARHLVRRHLPGPGELLRADRRSSPRRTSQMYPEFELPADQMKAWLADRQGAIVGARPARAVRLEGRRPRAAPGARSGARSDGGRPGSSTSSASTTAREGRRQDAVLLPLRLPRREPRSAAQATGRLVHRQDRRSGDSAARSAATIDAMFANSSAETKTDDREGVRRRASPSRSATSARSSIAILAAVLLHDPAGGRQHHGAVGARADQRAGRAEDARLHGRPDPGAGARRVVPDRRRSAAALGLGRRRGSSSRRAIRPAACCRSSTCPAATWSSGLRSSLAARARGRRAAGAPGDAAADRRRAAEELT